MGLRSFLIILVLTASSRSQDGLQPTLAKTPLKFKLFKHHSTVAWSCASGDTDAFYYEAGMAVDADGAFRAYHPNNRLGLDSIEHAGRPGHWWALATNTGNASGRPVVQRNSDPAPGYYVSMTSLFDASIRSERNPHRFVDAARIPYVVLPPIGFKHARLGDFVTVINLRNGRVAGAIVADQSSSDLDMGEGSIALAKALHINSNPRTGGIDNGVAYVIYPGSGNGKPRRLAEIALNSQRNFQAWGGFAKLRACLREKVKSASTPSIESVPVQIPAQEQ